MEMTTIAQNSLWVLGHRVTPVETSGQYDLVEIETPPHVPGPPPHMHNTYSELFYILEGEMEFFIEGDIRIVRAGEHVNISPNTLHTFNNRSGQRVRMLNVHSPKGFWSFFERFGVDSSRADALAASVEESVIQQVMTEAQNFDMIIKV